MCDRNCVSDAGRVPDLSASHGNEEGCLLDQLSWEGMWGPGAGTLAPTALQRSGREGTVLPLAWDVHHRSGSAPAAASFWGNCLGPVGITESN